MRPRAAMLAASVAVMAACSQTDAGNQAGNEQAREVTSTEAGPEPTASTDSSSNVAAGEEAVSSGMPVPGTNTPEHIVVNETPGNSD